MIRRKRSKVDGIYDVRTRDGARVRIKPFATTDHRIQNSQKKVIRDIMKKTIADNARANTLSAFVKTIIDGKLGSEIYKNCKKIYPVKRVEIYKTHVLSHPTTIIEEPTPPTPEKELEQSKTVDAKEDVEEQLVEDEGEVKEEEESSETVEEEEMEESEETESIEDAEGESEEPEDSESIEEEEPEVEEPSEDEKPVEPEKVEEEPLEEETEESEEAEEEKEEETSEEVPEEKDKKET
jgi:hypothetical protein